MRAKADPRQPSLFPARQTPKPRAAAPLGTRGGPEYELPEGYGEGLEPSPGRVVPEEVRIPLIDC